MHAQKIRGIFAILVLIMPCMVFSDELPSMEQLLTRHAARASQLNGVRVSWKGTTSMADPDNTERPEDLNTLGNDGVLTMKGPSVRTDRNLDVWDESTGSPMMDCTRVDTFAKGIGKTHYEYINHGNVHSSNDIEESFDMKLLVSTFASDPTYLTNPRYGVLRRETTENGSYIVVGNTDYGDRSDSIGGRTEFFLDEQKEFAPVKIIVMTKEGETVAETQLSYKEDADGQQIPDHLRTLIMDWLPSSGKLFLREAGEYSITDVVEDSSITDETFDVEFPPDTRVYDAIIKTDYIVGRSAAFDDKREKWLVSVALDAAKKIDALEEISPTSADTQQQTPDGDQPWRNWIRMLWALPIVLLGAIAIALIRKQYVRK